MTKRYYTAHIMLAFTNFSPDLKAWMLEMKKAGYNLFWAYMDYYAGDYIKWTKNFLDTAHEVNVPVMLGSHGDNSGEKDVQMVLNSWNHPAIFKLNGKKVYSKYSFFNERFKSTVDGLQKAGIDKSKYLFLVNGLYPVETTWKAKGTYSERVTGTPWTLSGVKYMYDHYDIDGIINFAIDKKLEANIYENSLIVKGSKERGKIAMAGISAYYASVSFYDYGFSGAANMWNDILKQPVADRPMIVNDTTANDYAELSYLSPMLTPVLNGLLYIPSITAGFTLGNNIRYPLTDHSGIQTFLRPWIDAYKSNAVQPVFHSDKIFAWYYLHPADVKLMPDIPEELSRYGKNLNQAWWKNTVYATGNIQIGGTNQVYGIQKLLGAGMGKIRMAAHLIKPAQLNINHTISEIFPAGAAYFEVEVNDFRGVPSFAIIRNGKVVRSGLGKQAITDSVWPGGWNCLVTKV